MGGICLNNIKYFDHAATTGVSKEVFKEMLPFLAQNMVTLLQFMGLEGERKELLKKQEKK